MVGNTEEKTSKILTAEVKKDLEETPSKTKQSLAENEHETSVKNEHKDKLDDNEENSDKEDVSTETDEEEGVSSAVDEVRQNDNIQILTVEF